METQLLVKSVQIAGQSSNVKRPSFIEDEFQIEFQNAFTSDGCQRISYCTCDCNKAAGNCHPFFG